MPRFLIPNSATIHNARSFIARNQPFQDDDGSHAVLEFNPNWVHVEPLALVMAAAWGAWARRSGFEVRVENFGQQTAYAARMKLFHYLGVDHPSNFVEHEEAGRFLPITQVRRSQDVSPVIANISALLHLQGDPDTLSAVQYCVSELLRNVLEHPQSPEGAFVCAHRFSQREPHRVTIAVADCGQGIHMNNKIVIEAGLNGFVEDKEQAKQIRLAKILPLLDRGESVVLDFKRVKYATQSYIHALIGEALHKHGEPVLSRLEFKNCVPTVRSVIELVVDYSLGGFPEQQTSKPL